jgi:hypothetical protein
MNAIGIPCPGPFARDVITRSDHAPTNNERHGDWARKFYGCGFHEMFKDTEAPAAHAQAFEAPVAVFH